MIFSTAGMIMIDSINTTSRKRPLISTYTRPNANIVSIYKVVQYVLFVCWWLPASTSDRVV